MPEGLWKWKRIYPDNSLGDKMKEQSGKCRYWLLAGTLLVGSGILLGSVSGSRSSKDVLESSRALECAAEQSRLYLEELPAEERGEWDRMIRRNPWLMLKINGQVTR